MNNGRLFLFLERWFRTLVRSPCMLCHQYAQGDRLCQECAEMVRRTPWGVSGLDCGDRRIPVLWREAYGGVLTQAIYRSKYRSAWGAARLLGHLLGALPRPWLGKDPVVVPIPLADHRLADRGYNQSLLIARAAARAWGLNAAPRLLRKRRRTARQASLIKAARCENLRDSFTAHAMICNQRVILVDDIMTSGATLREAQRAISQAGGEVIAAAVIARVHRDSRPRPQRIRNLQDPKTLKARPAKTIHA